MELATPINLFTSNRKFDDYQAPDMIHGDLTEKELKENYNLMEISDPIDPYLLTKNIIYYGNTPFLKSKNISITKSECADLLFEEFQKKASLFSFIGPYKSVIKRMIDHMQYNNGQPFSSPILNKALHSQILNDSRNDSTLKIIKSKFKANSYQLDEKLIEQIRFFLKSSYLPKFIRIKDNFNGLVITVHDIYAARIDIASYQTSGASYSLKLRYTIEDHFGLDSKDILHPIYSKLDIFKIWFFLQRHEKFGYKPFITKMETEINLQGLIS
jgi:uncharacterized protein (TIGR03034 family)